MHWKIHFVDSEWIWTWSLQQYKPNDNCNQFNRLPLYIINKQISEWNNSDMAKVPPAGHVGPAKLFLRPLSLGGLIFFCKMHPLKCHFWRKCWLFKPKMTFLKIKIWNVLGFLQICREIFKKLWTPLPPGMNLRPPEHYKLLKMARE